MRALDMNVLICVAVAGALAIGRWEEGAAVIVLFAVSLMLESYSSTRTRRALRSLMSLAPETASVLRDGRELVTGVADIRPGELIVIRPGDRVPLDGIVVDGRSTVDEAPITGESARRTKETGDTLAGSLNGTGALRLRTISAAGESTIARLLHLIGETRDRRAPVQNTVDRFARVYTPAVLGLSILVALTGILLPGASPGTWLYRSLVLLVIACPCALVIATPVAFVSALTNAARSGILIKGSRLWRWTRPARSRRGIPRSRTWFPSTHGRGDSSWRPWPRWKRTPSTISLPPPCARRRRNRRRIPSLPSKNSKRSPAGECGGSSGGRHTTSETAP
jgi:Cd2+/Zn2+-exporting ATPase